MPFHADAWVVLPDHMHCIWTLPEGDTDYSGRWRAIKKRFSKALPNVELMRPEVLAGDGRGVGQNRFWEHIIRHISYQMALKVTLGNFNVVPAPAGMTGLMGQSLCGAVLNPNQFKNAISLAQIDLGMTITEDVNMGQLVIVNKYHHAQASWH